MRRKTNSLTALTSAMALCAAMTFIASTARAQCEYPLFLQEGAVDANVLFIFDNSGSMNEVIWHDAYDPNASYSGKFSRTRMYYVSSDGTRTPRNFNKYWPSSPSAYLVNSDQSQNGRYIGNYLNWVYFHATPSQRASIPTVTRIQVAKPSVTSIIQNNPKIRFGVMTYNYDRGPSAPLAPIGTDQATLISRINGIAGDSWTPTAETMVSALEYISGDPSAIEYACQKTFLVVVTDGLPTKDITVPSYIGDQDGDNREPGDCASLGAPYSNSNDCSDYMDDVAYYLRNNDLRSDLAGDQVVYTYAVGFNVDARILQDTADNGDGLYVNAQNPAQLVASLQGILRDIVNRISAGSAVAVVSTEGHTQDRLFRGKFMPGAWKGFLEAFSLPYDPTDLPEWEAGQLLANRAADSRTIFSTLDGTQIEFRDAYANQLRPFLGSADDAEAARLINWVRGMAVPGLRDRKGWKLGDVIDSSPLVVGAPVGYRTYGDYLTWRDQQSNRSRVVYIGSNDGMVHTFREADGQELWAWIPQTLQGKLGALADTSYCHQFYVNLTPRVFDVYIGTQWRTLLIAGLKEGGDAYLALDVTNPESPQYMWETQIPGINESWSTPEIARVSSMGKTLAFVGSGPDEVNGQAFLMALDVETGQHVYTQLLSDNGGTGINMATSARAVDLDYDGWTDLVYVADLTGRLYRLDLRVTPWDLSVLFDSGGQPIQAQPILTVDYNGEVFLYFGTGRYLMGSDVLDQSQQTFYSVIDKHDGATVDRYDMIDETTVITKVGPVHRGWYIDLVQEAGERITKPDALVARFVYFTSFAPNDKPCSAGGTSWLYSVNFRNGASFDGDEDPNNDTTDGRVDNIGEGIATRPVVDVVNEKVIVQGSDTRIHVMSTKGIMRWVQVRSWRQRYN